MYSGVSWLMKGLRGGFLVFFVDPSPARPALHLLGRQVCPVATPESVIREI